MNILFHQTAFTDYQQWADEDEKIFSKIGSLIKEVTRTPFTGTGKPEPLRGNLSGFGLAISPVNTALFTRLSKM